MTTAPQGVQHVQISPPEKRTPLTIDTRKSYDRDTPARRPKLRRDLDATKPRQNKELGLGRPILLMFVTLDMEKETGGELRRYRNHNRRFAKVLDGCDVNHYRTMT